MSQQPEMIYHPTLKRMVPRPKEFRGDASFEREMDLPSYDDPRIKAEMALLESKKLTSSPMVNVEFALEQYEKNLALARAQTWNGQERWQGRHNEEARVVNVLSPTGFMRRLQRVGVDARLEWHRNARVWLNEYSRAGRVGVNANVVEGGEKVAKTLTTLQYPYGPEYEVLRFNEYNVPTTSKYRGWRTVLLELIRSNVITEEEADRAFGRARGPAADFYLRQVQEYRAYRLGLAS